MMGIELLFHFNMELIICLLSPVAALKIKWDSGCNTKKWTLNLNEEFWHFGKHAFFLSFIAFLQKN